VYSVVQKFRERKSVLCNDDDCLYHFKRRSLVLLKEGLFDLCNFGSRFLNSWRSVENF